MLAIEINQLNKSYKSGFKSTQVLHDLNMHVAQGEAYGFIGANGAGKSTMIKTIMDILRPDSGDIKLFGVEHRLPSSRISVSYLPENIYLYDYLTPLEIVSMGLKIHKVKIKDIKTHAMQWLERFNIAYAANKRIRNLSKGMMQRTGLAHAMACEPKLLILDEPLSGLDPVGRRDVVDILVEYRKQGGTLFFTSHVLFDVERVADRFGLIHEGRIIVEKTASDLFTESSGQFVLQIEAQQPLEEYQHEIADRYNLYCHRQQLWETLKRIEDAGHSLLSVKPQLTLEKAFFEYTKNSSNKQAST